MHAFLAGEQELTAMERIHVGMYWAVPDLDGEFAQVVAWTLK